MLVDATELGEGVGPNQVCVSVYVYMSIMLTNILAVCVVSDMSARYSRSTLLTPVLMELRSLKLSSK